VTGTQVRQYAHVLQVTRPSLVLHETLPTPATHTQRHNRGPDLQNILRQSYDNVKVMVDLQRTSNLQKHLAKGARLFLGTIHLQTYKIVRDSVRKLAYDIPKRNFSTF